MPAAILKKCIDEYITPLTYLVNLSIRQGTFPNELKLAKVILIFKSSNEQLIDQFQCYHFSLKHMKMSWQIF